MKNHKIPQNFCITIYANFEAEQKGDKPRKVEVLREKGKKDEYIDAMKTIFPNAYEKLIEMLWRIL